jgi:hypothetical protein
MGDLADALREAGHTEIANQLERKALAGDLRKVGRGDLADALESGEQHEATPAPATETEPEPTEPPTPQQQQQQFAENFRDALNASRTPWFGEGDDGA